MAHEEYPACCSGLDPPMIKKAAAQGDVVVSSVGARLDTQLGIFLDRSRNRIER